MDFPGRHPALVSTKLWQQAHDALSGKTRPGDNPIDIWKLTTPLRLSTSFVPRLLLNLKTGVTVILACAITYVTGGVIWSILNHWLKLAWSVVQE